MIVLLQTIVIDGGDENSLGGFRIEDRRLVMTTYCRLSSQGGLFRTVSRSGLGGGFRQREQHLDHVDPVNEDGEDVMEEKGLK